MRVLAVMSALLMTIAICVPIGASCEAVEPNLKIGNFWEYSFDMSEDWMILSGTVTMEIDETDYVLVDGVARDVFIVRSEGQGSIHGWYEGMEVTGSLDMGARETRLCSNFDVVSSTVWMDISFTYMSITVGMGMGYDMRFSPTVDDYIGDDDLVTGTEISGDSHIVGDMWIEFLGTTEHDILDDDFEYSLEITGTNVTKSTAAGTFPCSVVSFTSLRDDTYSNVGNNYYSELVGNYVFMESDSAHYNGMLGELSLVSYSYNPDGVPPVADAGMDITAKVGDQFTLNGSGSSDNVGVVNYTWELTRDGNVTLLYGPKPVLSIDKKGTYEVNLTVYDEAGNWDSDSVTVTIEEEGILTYFTGDKMWVGLSAIAAVVAIILLLGLLARRRRPTTATVPPPGQTSAPPAIQELSSSSPPQPQVSGSDGLVPPQP